MSIIDSKFIVEDFLANFERPDSSGGNAAAEWLDWRTATQIGDTFFPAIRMP